MSSIFDYLEWRGDLDFSAAPFNPVDNIILSILAYYPWEGIVGGPDSAKTIALGDASALLLSALSSGKKHLNMRFIFKDDQSRLLGAIRGSARFSKIGLRAFINQIDKKTEKQFAALTCMLGGKADSAANAAANAAAYIAFRGTDDSLVGWKEDFNMIHTEVIPAQLAAVRYLTEVTTHFRGPFHIGGHSKGGNLAVYAAAFCEKRLLNRLHHIYCNDGPGFNKTIVESGAYKRIVPRIISFIPACSIIGLLFEHGNTHAVVESGEKGLLQHNPFSWRVKRDMFIESHAVNLQSRRISKALMNWLACMDDRRRRLFTRALFDVLNEAGVSSINDLTRDWFSYSVKIIKAITGYDKETQDMLAAAAGSLFEMIKNEFSPVMKLNFMEAFSAAKR